MALTDPQTTEIARKLAQKIFVASQATAHSNVAELKAAVSALDAAMGATGNQIASIYPTTILKAALLQEIQNDNPSMTTLEAGILLAYWALREVGLL